MAEYLNGGPADAGTLEGKFGTFLNGVMSDYKWSILFGYLESQNQIVNHYIPDPLLQDERDLLAYVKAFGQRFTVAATDNAQRRQFTSWNNQKTALDQDLTPPGNIPANSELGPDIGRSGYSVRFISFRSLVAGGRGTNDRDSPDTSWSNPFNRFDAGGGRTHPGRPRKSASLGPFRPL